MDNINPIALQKQIRDNSEEYSNCLRDLKSWESEMKRKESELQKQNVARDDLPPVRSRSSKSVKKAKADTNAAGSATKKIPGFDYASWDRFNVDQACADVDIESEETETESESDEEVTEQRARDEAMFEKEKGNRHVKSKKWIEAIQCYSRAIECYPHDAIYYANRALCYLKTNKFESANDDCTTSLTIDSEYVKAYQRRAAAREGLGQLMEARDDLMKVMELEPMNTASKSELIKIEKLINVAKLIQPGGSGDHKHSTSPAQECGPPVVKMSWGSEDGVKLVQPIYKPPHLRSKKPMQRIAIEEVGRCSSSQPTEMADVRVEVTNVPTTLETAAEVQIASTSKSETIAQIQVCEIQEQVPSRPVSSVEFLVGWRKVKPSPDLAFQYIQQIPGLELPNIFLESLEPSTFSDIISILGSEFLLRNEPVYPYLSGIARVKRLSALTMFMSSSDAAILKQLLNHCVETKECSSEQAAELRAKYELT